VDTPDPQRLATDARTLRMLALTITMGVVVFTVAFAVLINTGSVDVNLQPDFAFYIAAGASILSIIVGFGVQRRLTDTVLPATSDYAAASHAIRTHTIISLAAMEAGALVGGLMGLLSGQLAPLAFVVPFFAFVWLFFPSEARYQYWQASAGAGGGGRK
jgi:hypothetical protein